MTTWNSENCTWHSNAQFPRAEAMELRLPLPGKKPALALGRGEGECATSVAHAISRPLLLLLGLALVFAWPAWAAPGHAPLTLTRGRTLAVLGTVLSPPPDSPALNAHEPTHTSAPGGCLKTRKVPTPLPDHPGNIFVEGEAVRVTWPKDRQPKATQWRLLDDRQRVLRQGEAPHDPAGSQALLQLGLLEIGWYRLELGSPAQPDQSWTTLAVLGRLRAPVPKDSPVGVDVSAAWLARDDGLQQKRLANLASLAGVSWVRDRLRWRDLQPRPGALVAPPTTYDSSADAFCEAGLQVLQVFHDTPPWAREHPEEGGRFAPDLRHVYGWGQALARRFQGRVAAWEPWNEANVATFGGHTVDQMCAWQKAAWLGFKAGDPAVVVGWNPTAAVPTPAHTEGVLANQTWPYFNTYNLHSYDWAHAYADLWQPAREGAAGRPLWITEADRGTPHLGNAPWYDQDPRLERLKAEWMAQAYAQSLAAGAARHFHFILGHYQEPQGVQFGLLRLDLTPRPAYVALAAVGRWLAGAKALGRWRPGSEVHGFAFRAQPDGFKKDVLVVWAEKDVDWPGRGTTTAPWQPPANLPVLEVVDYLGRSHGTRFPQPLTSAPVFLVLPPGQAATLPLEPPPPLAAPRPGAPSPVVLQLSLPRSSLTKVEDLPWSEGYAYQATAGRELALTLHAYNFAPHPAVGRLRILRQPPTWAVTLPEESFTLPSMARQPVPGSLRIPAGTAVRDGWVVLQADYATPGPAALAFRVVVKP